jgi:hypothetical protein
MESRRRKRHAIHRRCHAELADAVINVAPAIVSDVSAAAFGLGVVRPSEICQAPIVEGSAALIASSAISDALRVATGFDRSAICDVGLQPVVAGLALHPRKKFSLATGIDRRFHWHSRSSALASTPRGGVVGHGEFTRL